MEEEATAANERASAAAAQVQELLALTSELQGERTTALEQVTPHTSHCARFVASWILHWSTHLSTTSSSQAEEEAGAARSGQESLAKELVEAKAPHILCPLYALGDLLHDLQARAEAAEAEAAELKSEVEQAKAQAAADSSQAAEAAEMRAQAAEAEAAELRATVEEAQAQAAADISNTAQAAESTVQLQALEVQHPPSTPCSPLTASCGATGPGAAADERARRGAGSGDAAAGGCAGARQ